MDAPADPGEGVHPRKLEAIHTLIGADPSVEEVVRVLTMHFGPQEILLNLDIRFREELTVTQVTEAIDRIEQTICRAHPDVKRIFIEIESLSPKRRAGRRELYASGV